MKRHLQSLFPLGLASAAVIGTPLLAIEAQAAESILVRYKDTEVNVTRRELDNFSDTGEIPTSLQNLLNTDAELPKTVRTLLSDQLTVPKFMKNFIEGSNGEFLLFKLDQVISSADGSTERGLNSLKTAVLDSIADDRISFLEIIDKHPQNTIRLDITSLEGTYNDVSGFVERVLPALEVAKGVLSDFICDCNTTQASPNGTKAQTVSNHQHHSQRGLEDCDEAVVPTTTSTEPGAADGQLTADETDIKPTAKSIPPTHQPLTTSTKVR